MKTWLRAAHSRNPRHSRLNGLVLRRDQYDFARLDEFQFFSGEFFDRVGIAAKGLDLLGELLVLGVESVDFGLRRREFFRLGMHLKQAFIVEDREKKHRDREKAEHDKSDPNDSALHQASVIHCLPYSKRVSRSSRDVDSA